MNDYSLAVIVGRLTRDPELKYTKDGIPYARLSVAVNRPGKSDDGAAKTTVSFIDVTVWRRMAELCTQFLKKGRTVLVVGAIKQSRWKAPDGSGRSRTEVIADRVQFLDRREEGPAAGAETDPEVEHEAAGQEDVA